MSLALLFVGIATIVLEYRRRVAALELGRTFGHFCRLKQSGNFPMADLLVLNDLTGGRLMDLFVEAGGVVTLRFWMHKELTAARHQLRAEYAARHPRAGEEVA